MRRRAVGISEASDAPLVQPAVASFGEPSLVAGFPRCWPGLHAGPRGGRTHGEPPEGSLFSLLRPTHTVALALGGHRAMEEACDRAVNCQAMR